MYRSNISNPCNEIPLYPTVQCPVCKSYRTEVLPFSTVLNQAITWTSEGVLLICDACHRDKQIDICTT